MGFLCKGMERQAVNGNGTRPAGNPNKEPILSRFPNCPPVSMVQTETNVAIPTATLDAAAILAANEQFSAQGKHTGRFAHDADDYLFP